MLDFELWDWIYHGNKPTLGGERRVRVVCIQYSFLFESSLKNFQLGRGVVPLKMCFDGLHETTNEEFIVKPI